MFTKEAIYLFLSKIPDPEIPVISILDLGIVRNVELIEGDTNSKVRVQITPTYSGCPAMKVIEDEIVKSLIEEGVNEVEVCTVYAPPWTTDWISEEGRNKLKEYGIAPPRGGSGDELIKINAAPETMPCPFCDSKETQLRSEFGSTPCKGLCYCKNCNQPFEYFKVI